MVEENAQVSNPPKNKEKQLLTQTTTKMKGLIGREWIDREMRKMTSDAYKHYNKRTTLILGSS